MNHGLGLGLGLGGLFQPYKKAAFCFLISGKHVIHHEALWRRWIHENRDIIDVYIHCTDPSLVRSSWIRQHLLPAAYSMKTDYMHVIPAYTSLLDYVYKKEKRTQWFCFLTESCVPIVSPFAFRRLFFMHNGSSIFSWKRAWWNVRFVHRANLHVFSPQYHLGHAPWFILSRREVDVYLQFIQEYSHTYRFISAGAVANESLFAVVFKKFGLIDVSGDGSCFVEASSKNGRIINEVSTLTDWSRMTSATSPYVFREDSLENRAFIEKELAGNKFAVFLRKVDASFPASVLDYYIYEYRGAVSLRDKIGLWLLEMKGMWLGVVVWFLVGYTGGFLGLKLVERFLRDAWNAC
jgi:hypothetical protein